MNEPLMHHADGEAALRGIPTEVPDVVLMDINLPGIDGIEATYRMKALAQTTAVVVLSAHDTPHHRLVAEKAGAAGYIAKADMEKQLEPTVRGLLRSRTRS